MSLLERRLNVLEQRVALLEARLMHQASGVKETISSEDDRDKVRLSHILAILESLGGSGSLDQIAKQNSSITKSGTLAQLVRLCNIGLVERPKRGQYALAAE